MRSKSFLAIAAIIVAAIVLVPLAAQAQAVASVMQPAALKVDAHTNASTTSDGNGLLEPGESVLLEPAWTNTGASATAVTGSATYPFFTGPAGASYAIDVPAADYGTIAAGATANCYDATPANACYQVSVVPIGQRPVLHWDATFSEMLSTGETKTWTIHIGDSFTDVAETLPFYRFIETILHKGITGGCGTTTFCPSDSVTRGQMAVFLLVGEHGSGYVPPACTSPVFTDVPCSSGLAPWVDQLVAEGITAGCGGGLYCPATPVTRAQMAVFLLIAKHGSGYNPPPATGTVFADVPASDPFAKWIEELFNEGITGGCGGGNFCPGNPSIRAQMAVFLTTTFSLSLYGP